MNAPKDGQLSFVNLRRSWLSELTRSYEQEALRPSDAYAARARTWRPFASSGYRDLLTKHKAEARPGIGHAAELWAEDAASSLSATTRAVRLSEAMGFELFWLFTGASPIISPRQFDWLADAFIVDTICNREFPLHLSGPDVETLIQSRYRLIRQFALFCKGLPTDHSDFANAVLSYRPKPSELHPRFGEAEFDARVRSNAARYLTIIAPRYRRPSATAGQ